MEQWIYLKNANPCDALAFASVLSSDGHQWNIVHASSYSRYLRGLHNIIIGHPESENCDILILESKDCADFSDRCNHIASQLKIDSKEKWSMYTYFSESNSAAIKQLESLDKIILLFFFPQENMQLDLMMIEQTMHCLKNEGYCIVDGNSIAFPNIRRTKDFRDLVKLDEILECKSNISIILTTESWLPELCEEFNIKCISISSQGRGFLTKDGFIEHPMQFANYIQNLIK